jgi:NAD(P)-dependent dehydrogenase (short-subunit alcohol dehydrogenase family)
MVNSAVVGQFDGRVALVTGGGSGIGSAVARRFARVGAAVMVADINGLQAEAVAAAIDREGGRATSLRVDVSDAPQVQSAVDRTQTEFGGLDILVTCAGILDFGSVVEMDLERWNRVIGVNLTGTFLCARAAIPAMIERGGGAIVTFSSSTGPHDAAPGLAAYVASKGGVAMLTKCLALDHADIGIRANTIAPGPTATPMLRNVMTADALAAFGQAMPIGRMAEPEEIAAVALFLASDEASYVTGAVIPVDGGQTANIGMTLKELGTVASQSR